MSPRGLAFSVSVSHAGDISVLRMLNRCFAGPYPPKSCLAFWQALCCGSMSFTLLEKVVAGGGVLFGSPL